MSAASVFTSIPSSSRPAETSHVVVVASPECQAYRAEVALGDLPYARSWERLAKRWRERLAKATRRMPLSVLYRGAYWKASMALCEAAGSSVRMYVVSPGLGLRPLNWIAPAYTAKFNGGTNSPLALARRYDWPRRRAARDWWRALTGGGGWGRILEGLGDTDQLLVVLPVTTWRAVGESLAEALSVRPRLLPRVWLLCTGNVLLP